MNACAEAQTPGMSWCQAADVISSTNLQALPCATGKMLNSVASAGPCVDD